PEHSSSAVGQGPRLLRGEPEPASRSAHLRRAGPAACPPGRGAAQQPVVPGRSEPAGGRGAPRARLSSRTSCLKCPGGFLYRSHPCCPPVSPCSRPVPETCFSSLSSAVS